MKELQCGHCAFESEWGVTVCRGCGSDIVYGPTEDEYKRWRMIGGSLGFVVATAALNYLPGLLSPAIAPWFGLGAYGALVIIGAMGAGAYWANSALEVRRAGLVRMFRRTYVR